MTEKTLPERLRAFDANKLTVAEAYAAEVRLFKEAADEIERLTAERDDYKHDSLRLHKDKIDYLERALAAEAELARVKAERDAIRAATVEECAKVADALDTTLNDHNSSIRHTAALIRDRIRALATVPVNNKWRHVKRGTIYTEVGRGKAQTDTMISDDDAVVIYIGSDGQYWVRPPHEFETGASNSFTPQRRERRCDGLGTRTNCRPMGRQTHGG